MEGAGSQKGTLRNNSSQDTIVRGRCVASVESITLPVIFGVFRGSKAYNTNCKAYRGFLQAWLPKVINVIGILLYPVSK